jgi:hypothetical protein
MPPKASATKLKAPEHQPMVSPNSEELGPLEQLAMTTPGQGISIQIL